LALVVISGEVWDQQNLVWRVPTFSDYARTLQWWSQHAAGLELAKIILSCD
jgi:hypothetical protein